MFLGRVQFINTRIWTNSDIQSVIRRNQVCAVLLGQAMQDLVFSIANDTWQSRAFMLTKKRFTIERCFGQVKQMFKILQHNITFATQIDHSVLLLHNVAKYLKDSHFQLEEHIEENFDD